MRPSDQRLTRGLPAAVLAAFLALVPACGRVGDPIPPPSRRLESTRLLDVFQRGNRLLLQWPRPNLTNGPNATITRVDLFRLVEDASAPRVMREEIFLERAQLVASLKRADLDDAEGQFLTHEEPLEATGGDWSGRRYRYALRYADAREQFGALSNFAFATPSDAVPTPPRNPSVTPSQTALTLAWEAPTGSVGGGPAPAVIGYNVYRRPAKGEFPKRPLNSAPLKETRFEDTKFRFGAEYAYVVRGVTEVGGDLVESLDSAEVTVTPRDTFIPESPRTVTGASAAGIASLFWPANQEPDIKGYNVYRAEKSDAPVWTRLTPSPIAPTTFRDTTGEKGKTYLYRVTAVDAFDNESAPSEAVPLEIVN